jgi:hypothetical protein
MWPIPKVGKPGEKSAISLGAGSAELNSQVLTRVNPLSPNHRSVIALRSLGGVFETGLARRRSEKRSTKQAHGPGRDVFSSPVQRENPKNCADFSQFSGKCSEVSLRCRLRGGAGWIRTLGTGLSGARADVCVGYRESIFYPEKEGRLVLRHCGPDQCGFQPN